eukprot:10700598-Heterocapsa_arctica.AAC.1
MSSSSAAGSHGQIIIHNRAGYGRAGHGVLGPIQAKQSFRHKEAAVASRQAPEGCAPTGGRHAVQ